MAEELTEEEKRALANALGEIVGLVEKTVQALTERFPKLTEEEEIEEPQGPTSEEVSALLLKHDYDLVSAREFAVIVVESGFALDSLSEALQGSLTHPELDMVVRSNLPVKDVLEWRKAGLGPIDEVFRDWYSSFDDVEEAKSWKEAGYSANEAVEWLVAVETLEEANEWKKAEFNPSDAHNWKAVDIPVAEAMGWKGAEVTPPEAKVFREQGLKPEDV